MRIWRLILSQYGFKEKDDGPGREMSAKLLYDRFARFCADNDTDVMTQQKFGKEMTQKFNFRKKRISDGIVYVVFGASEKDLGKPYFIAEEDGAEPSSESFIKEDD